jgi:hypothetical protein
MTWLQNVFNFLALNLLRLFAFLPYVLTIVESNTVRPNKYIEDLVLERPAEYYWVHERFKHRPPGEPSLYN